MEELIDYLESIPTGAIEDSDTIAGLLVSCWDELEWYDIKGMRADKFYRMENVSWNPPILRFEIERHGAMLGGGSTRAEIQFWEVDVEEKTLEGGDTGRYRQKYPKQPPLNVKPIAKEIAESIINKQEDKRLKWNKDGTVRVVIGHVIPSKDMFNQTVFGRRKRFNTALESLLTAGSWHKVRANNYARQLNNKII